MPLDRSAFEVVLRDIITVARDNSINEEILRLRVEEIAMKALKPEPVAEPASVDPPKVVAWLYLQNERFVEVRTKLRADQDWFEEAIPLSTVPNGDIIAWRWCDGGGYNSDFRYSFIDPTEDPEEVERLNAESVISCEPLYVHSTEKAFKK
jgi:hypothetical protein